MSQTVSQYITSLLEKYTPSSGEFDAARRHRGGIESRLDWKFGLREMFETGSLRHGTGVSLYSDADYIACLKGFQPSPATALSKVRDTLKDKYPSTVIQVRSPAVVCKFNGGRETVEVVPAYLADDGYWIASPKTGEWMRAHPKGHNEYVGDVNRKHSGAAKKMARLAKTWKYKRNVPISSCYLEMRAAKYVDDETFIDLVQDIHRYFSWLEDINLASMNDPTGKNARFNAYSSESNKTDALSKLSTAVVRAKKAREYAAKDEHASAITQLKLLFDQ